MLWRVNLMDFQTIIVSAVVGILTSAITTSVTLPLRMKEERQKLDLRIKEEREKLYLRLEEEKEKWTRDFALKYAEKQATDNISAQRIAEQFAVGLLIYDNPSTAEREKFFLPSNSRLMAGRASDNPIIINNSRVSAKHCSFEADDRNVYVRDLGTMNGVFVNDDRVKESQKLYDGDIVGVGTKVKLKFHQLS